MSLKVAILGCGPAGLLAAHAVQANGCDFTIFSRKVKSQLYGSQYLHQPIPGITGVSERVKYDLVGTPEQYRAKVYGDNWDGTVSPEDYQSDHDAWDIRAAYSLLWRKYNQQIHNLHIDNLRQVRTDAKLDKFDMVLSTVPRRLFGAPTDKFEFTKIWALGDAPEEGIFAPFSPEEDNLVICDGTKVISWYRISKVFGYTTIEWPGTIKPPIEGVQTVAKPLKCNMHQNSGFQYLGRYGKWEKGVLSTDAYYEALALTSKAKAE